MIDFTSSLYLGMAHGSVTLPPWSKLTCGRPAALGSPPGAREVARSLAERVGLSRAVLSPSTLHIAWDLFAQLCRGGDTSIHVDRGAYPVLRWGIERAAARGAPVHVFAHHDPGSLHRSLAARRSRGPALVVCDGCCPACGRLAPLDAYQRAARATRGVLIIDDTQALGVWGRPAAGAPYGQGGGGSLRALGVGGRVLLVASLAKAFGAPLAALSGSRADIDAFVRDSDTRVHCSPPSLAAIRAAARALQLDHARGDARRARLHANVRRLRAPLLAAGLEVRGASFPVQSLPLAPGMDPVELHRALLARGIRTFVTQSRCEVGPRLGMVVRADHLPEHLERAAHAVLEAYCCGRMQNGCGIDREGKSPCGRRETDTRCTSPGRACGPSWPDRTCPAGRSPVTAAAAAAAGRAMDARAPG